MYDRSWFFQRTPGKRSPFPKTIWRRRGPWRSLLHLLRIRAQRWHPLVKVPIFRAKWCFFSTKLPISLAVFLQILFGEKLHPKIDLIELFRPLVMDFPSGCPFWPSYLAGCADGSLPSFLLLALGQLWGPKIERPKSGWCFSESGWNTLKLSPKKVKFDRK